MKRFLVLFVAIAFFGGIALVGCGPKKEEAPKPPESTEQAAPAPAPAPEKAPTAAPAAPEKAPEAAPAPEKAPQQPK